jgi:methylmalonyl-CoA carboxyltransferase 5S subunit
MTGEFADLMLGYYGATAGKRKKEIVEGAKTHNKKPPIETRPADLLKPEWKTLCTEATALEGCDGTDEDVLTYAMFPKVAPKFFASRSEGPKNVGKEPSTLPAVNGTGAPNGSGDKAPLNGRMSYKVTLGSKTHQIIVEPA